MAAGIDKTLSQMGAGFLQGTVTSMATSTINSVTYSADGGWGFDSDGFSKSIVSGLVGSAVQAAQTVTAGVLGQMNLKDGNGISLNGHTFDTESIQKLNNFTGSLAGAGLNYALSGEVSLNVLNLSDLTGGKLNSGLLELRLGKDGTSMSIGTGGTDVSLGTVAVAMAGLKDSGKVVGAKLSSFAGNQESVSTFNSVNMLGWTGQEYEQGLAKAVWDGELKVKYADLEEGAYGEYRVGEDGITISKTMLGGGKEGSAKLAAVMSHEGTHVAGNRVEALAHLQGNSTYNTVNAVFGLAGNAEFSQGMTDAIYDPGNWVANTGDVDYWLVKATGSMYDDGNDGVISFEDGRETIHTKNKGKQGSLEEYLGMEAGTGYGLLMGPAGFAYDAETKTWTGSGKTISADTIQDLTNKGVITASVTAVPATETGSPVPDALPETKQSLLQRAKAAASDGWDKFKVFVAPVTVPASNFITGLLDKLAFASEIKPVPEVKEENKAKEESKDSTAFTSKPVASGRLSSPYGNRKDVDVNKVGDFHSGVDYGVPKGTNVMATASGEVVEAVNNQYYGNLVSIKHDNGFTSYSMHLDTTLVKQGDIIKGGTVIGTSGNTGEFASGQYHLHFSIYPSSIAPKLGADKTWDVKQSVNPMNYLPK